MHEDHQECLVGLVLAVDSCKLARDVLRVHRIVDDVENGWIEEDVRGSSIEGCCDWRTAVEIHLVPVDQSLEDHSELPSIHCPAGRGYDTGCHIRGRIAGLFGVQG